MRDAVFADPYAALPTYPVDAAAFGPGGHGDANHLLAAARRTLRSDADLVTFAQGRKLFQPNGICFSGSWEVTADRGYTGLFAPRGPVDAIVRASVMLDGTRRGDRRAFGIAVKLFPQPAPGAATRSFNLLLMESMGGRRFDHVLDAVVDNEPALGGLPPLVRIPTLLRIRRDLKRADSEIHGRGGSIRYRSAAALATPGATSPRAPHWVRLRVAADHARVDADDFRDELTVARYPGERITYRIEVADAVTGGKSQARWQAIGRLLLIDSVVSASCDTRLHFPHPGPR